MACTGLSLESRPLIYLRYQQSGALGRAVKLSRQGWCGRRHRLGGQIYQSHNSRKSRHLAVVRKQRRGHMADHRSRKPGWDVNCGYLSVYRIDEVLNDVVYISSLCCLLAGELIFSFWNRSTVEACSRVALTREYKTEQSVDSQELVSPTGRLEQVAHTARTSCSRCSSCLPRCTAVKVVPSVSAEHSAHRRTPVVGEGQEVSALQDKRNRVAYW